MAGLTSEFGMGSGDPRLHGRARRACSHARIDRERAPWRLHGALYVERDRAARFRAEQVHEKRRARAISTARLSGSPRLQLRPIYQMVYLGPYHRGNSSWGRLPA